MPGPANLYGVSNPVILPVNSIVGTTVNLTAGVKTTFLTIGPLVALSSGVYSPIIWLTVGIGYGATVSTTINFAFQLNGGSDVDSWGFTPYPYVANASQIVSLCLIGTPSNTAWQAPGSTITISGNAAAQLAQARQGETRAIVTLLRAPDQ